MPRTKICELWPLFWIFTVAAANLFTNVKAASSDEVPRFTAEPADAIVLPGGSAVLHCAAAGGASGNAPRWRFAVAREPRRDNVVQFDEQRKLLSNGSLQISDMSAAVAGHYQCEVSATAGVVVSRVARVTLAELPSFKAPPRSIVSVAGGVTLLPCGLDASVSITVVGAGVDRRGARGNVAPTPPSVPVNVTWLKDGVPLVLDAARMTVLPRGALEVLDTAPRDAGVYACRAALPRAPPSLHRTGEPIELRVTSEESESAPRFIVTPEATTALEGAKVTLECACAGNPPPPIQWLHNGAPIDLSSLDSPAWMSPGGSLVLSGVRPREQGHYTCQVAGLSPAHAALTVHSPPRVWWVGAGAGPVTAALRGEVTLQCGVKGSPTPRLRWYKDGELLTPNQRDIAAVDGSLRIAGVLALDAGVWQCAAGNAAGDAVRANRLIVRQHAEHDDFKPSDIQKRRKSNKKHQTKMNSKSLFNSLKTDEIPIPNGDTNSLEVDYLVDNQNSTLMLKEQSLDYLDYDYTLDYSLQAAEGFNLDALKAGNATLDFMLTGLRAVIVKHRFVTLSWDEAPINVTGYAVVYKVKGSERELMTRVEGSKHEVIIGNLQPNTTYTFCALAYTDRGATPVTQEVEAHTSAEEESLPPPARVWAAPSEAGAGAGAGAGGALVSWQPGAAHSDHLHYAVRYTDVQTGRSSTVWSEAGATSVALTGLRSGAAYRVSVAAAPPRWSAPAALALPPRAPPAPATVRAHRLSATSVVVTWEAVAAGAVSGWRVRGRGGAGGGGRARPPPLTVPPAVTRAVLDVPDLDNDYQVRVCSISEEGSGGCSEWVSLATPAASITPSPSLPRQPPPISSRAGRDWISLWWSRAEPGVTALTLGWGLGVPDDSTRALPAAARAHVVRNLQPNSEYVISLRASNAHGTGPPVYATVRTRADVDTDGDADAPDDPCCPQPNSEYVISLRASNAHGTGPPVYATVRTRADVDTDGDADAPDEDADLPDDEDEDAPAPAHSLIPPIGVKAIMLSGTTAVVYWSDPTLPNEQNPILVGRRYLVKVVGPSRTKTYNATDLNLMIDDLKPYTDYEFAVKLIKGSEESMWSMLCHNRSLTARPAAPPRDVRAAPAPPPGALHWAPPARPGGEITGYVVTYTAAEGAGGAGAVGVLHVAGDARQVRLDALQPHTQYRLSVQARNSAGLGPQSAPIVFTTGESASDAGAGGAWGGGGATWAWALVGGAGGALLLAAVAAALCARDRRHHQDTHTTYQKSAATAALKPPDLWIHHDQMELKHLDKHPPHANMSNSSIDGCGGGGGGMMAMGAPTIPRDPRPASLDRRQYVPTYVEEWSVGGDSDVTARGAGAATPTDTYNNTQYSYLSMGGPGCVATCDRRLRSLGLTSEQGGPLLSSPQGTMTSRSNNPCGGGGCSISSTCPLAGGGAAGAGGALYACARERGHYVAYEPLAHYAHRERESSVSECGRSGCGSSLGGGGQGGAAGAGAGGTGGAPLCSFPRTDAGSDRSTPTHSRGSGRETSPYKKSASSSPGHPAARVQLPSDAIHPCELEALTPSRSSERLQREMDNLEGLMRDLTDITRHHHYHC